MVNRAKPVNPAAPLPPIDEYHTRSTYDIQGNVLQVTDALNRVAFQFSGKKDSITPDDGRGVAAPGKLRLPLDMRIGSPLGGEVLLFGNAVAQRPTPAGPV